jgi:hypothetical protein
MAAAAAAERLLLGTASAPRGPQLFVLGLPRSGTTLVYQYLAHRYAVSYFTNAVGRFPCAACLCTTLATRRLGRYVSDFASEYGKSVGPLAPREAGDFWTLFFAPDRYVSFDELPEPARVRLRRTVACVQRAFGGAPFVNKNVMHAQRVDALALLFPEARFLVVERALADVGLSVLRGRSRHAPGAGDWWSIRPTDHAAFAGLPLPEQIAGQLASVGRRLAEDLGRLPAERVLGLDYEAFCAAPDEALAGVRAALGAPATRSPAVPAFARARNAPASPEEERLLALLAGDSAARGIYTAARERRAGASPIP